MNVVKKPNKTWKFFKDPHKIEQKIGKLSVGFTIKYSKDFPNTSQAMDSVAKAESKDDVSKRKGNNDYSLSLEKLLHSFDTYIRELSKGLRIGGHVENFDRSNRCELTILLLWQIRHVLTHQGGLVDEKCKEKYENIIEGASKNGNTYVIDLPTTLEVGQMFTIEFEDYLKVRTCVFNYIKERSSEEDYKILHKRASITDIKIDKVKVIMEYPAGTVEINLAEALDHGFEIDYETAEIIPPANATYDLENERITIQSTGKSFPAKIVTKL